jgi:hypothetical protein
VCEQHDVVRVRGGKLEVVEHDDDGVTAFSASSERLEHELLVTEIERGRGFV